MGVDEAIKLARKREDEESYLDALVLHKHLHEGRDNPPKKTLLSRV